MDRFRWPRAPGFDGISRPAVVMRYTPFRTGLFVFALLLFIAYLGYCVLALSPRAKAEFVHIFLNPEFIYRLFP